MGSETRRWRTFWEDYGNIIGIVALVVFFSALLAVAAWFDGFARGATPMRALRRLTSWWRFCPRCKGFTTVGWKPCPRCHGTGKRFGSGRRRR